jgi:hypothetical protein
MIAYAEAQVEIACFKIDVLEEEVEQTLTPTSLSFGAIT